MSRGRASVCEQSRPAIAELDLTNRQVGCIDLPENYRRVARRASRCSARRKVAASPDLNSRLCWIEVRFEHGLFSITICLL
jgi:hypothetical protein